MTGSTCPAFSKWRALLWPVHRHELGKLIPILIMFFFLYLNYNILRCIKDSLIITAKGSGAEVIPFIKVWAMFPFSIFFAWIYIKFSSRFSREAVFYILFSVFLGFFALFGFFFYPMRESFHLHSLADSLSNSLPIGCQGFVSMIRYWSFTLFYVMAELWRNIIITVLFWGLINQITQMEEAKRFYAIFGIGLNLSGIFSGELSIEIVNFVTAHGGSWNTSLTYLLSLVCLSGLVCLITFAYLHRYNRKHKITNSHENLAPVPNKQKMSFRKSLSFILSSKYMLCLMTIVLSYNIIINLVEILWKHEAKELYPDTLSYTIFMNEVTIYTGIFATAISLFISGNCLRTLGWTKTSLITPIILFITSVGFFTAFFLKTNSTLPILLGGGSQLVIVVFFGTIQNCLSRAAKYTFFDDTKEMAYIPLSQEEKVKGKAAIDGVFDRMGKSTGSVIYQGLLIIVSTITASAPYVAAILLGCLIVWTLAIFSLGSQISQLTAEQQSKQNLEPAIV